MQICSDILARYPDALRIAGLTFIVTTLFTALLYHLARKLSLLPGIRSRDVHKVRTPRVGGVAIWIAVTATILWMVGSGMAGDFQFGQPGPGGVDTTIWGILGGMAILLVVGIIDDLKGVPWGGQLLGQLAAGVALVVSGVDVPLINLPLGFHVDLPAAVSAVFVVLWVATMINVMNWFDGLDGLAGSISLTASVVLYLISIQLNLVGTATLALIIMGSSAAFLVWNWHPAKLFMGTVGSQVLGFLLAVTAIISGAKLATVALVLGIPVMDAVLVVFRRLRAGESIFAADQRHLHHRLLKIGLSVPWVVIVINAVAVTFGLLALYNPGATTKAILLVILASLMALFILGTYILERQATRRVH